MKCEAAVWQKEGYDVTKQEKLVPCVEMENLWEYDPQQPIGYYMGLQNVIRDHALESHESVFCKVDPMAGTAIVWFKGAKDAMSFASKMHKSYFMGRKVAAALTRKAKPKTDDWNGIKDFAKTNNAVDDAIERARKAGTFTLFPDLNKLKQPPPPPPDGSREASEAMAAAFAEDIAAVTDEEGEEPKEKKPKAQPFRLKQGTRVVLKDLTARPESNGTKGEVLKWLSDIQKYQVQLDFGSKVKIKIENLEVLDEASSFEQIFTCEHKAAQREDQAADAMAASLAAKFMAEKLQKPKAIVDATAADFEATVCVDAALLRKTVEEERRLQEEEEKAAEARRRQRSRSRSRIQRERLEAAQARLAEGGSTKSKWVLSSPADVAAAAKLVGGQAASEKPREPEESREELMKMSVSKLKTLLVEFGKTARGCIEKRDFVDRLKPPPKT